MLEIFGEEIETGHQDAAENTNTDQQMSVDTNESTEAVGQEVVRQEMVEPPSTDRHESSQGPLMRHGDMSSPTGSEDV